VFSDVDRGQVAWGAFGVALAAAVGFVLYSFVGTFVFAAFIYYATRPIYRRLKRRIRPPSLAAATALVVLVLPALALVTYAVLVVVAQLNRLANGMRSDVAAALGVDLAALPSVRSPAALLEIDPRAYLSLEQIVGLAGQVGGAVDVLAEVGVFLIHVFVMIAVAFYLLRDDARIARWVKSRFGDEGGVLHAYLAAVDRDMDRIFFGNILNAVLTGTIGVIVYSALDAVAPAGLGVPVPALVGALAGVASLIPVVGMKLVYVPVALYLAAVSAVAGFTGAWFVVVFAGVSLVVVDTIPDLVLRPYVSGRNLHVGAVMVAYTLGPLLFGWYGIFLLPILLVLVVHFARVVLPELVAGTPLRPYAVDPGAVSSGAVDDGVPSSADPAVPEATPGPEVDGDADRDVPESSSAADSEE
jgi:predicted PurR-regulated permease PerM